MRFASRITVEKARWFGIAGEVCGVPGSVVGSVTVAPVPLAGWAAGGGAGGAAGCCCANAGAARATAATRAMRE
ncbi:hypothetical protein D3C83_211820 [compost metagenome]